MPVKKTTALKDKIKDFESTGQVSLSSADIAEFKQPEPEVKEVSVNGDVKIKASTLADRDPLINTTEVATDQLKTTMGLSAPVINIVHEDIDDKLEEVVITQADKDRFIDALVANTRFELPFTIFNGRIKGTFRSRKQKESLAILSQLRRETDNGEIKTLVEHATRTRQFCLLCQLKELRGTQFQEFTDPMFNTLVEGKEVSPAWLINVKFFDDMEDGLLVAVYRQLRIFEKKYWTMIENAEEQNFWKTEESS